MWNAGQAHGAGARGRRTSDASEDRRGGSVLTKGQHRLHAGGRRAGSQHVSGATTGHAAAAVAQVAPSVALTPYNKLASNRPAIADPEPIWTPKRAALKRGGVDENRCPNAEKGRLAPPLRWNSVLDVAGHSAYSRWRANGPTVTLTMQPWFSPARQVLPSWVAPLDCRVRAQHIRGIRQRGADRLIARELLGAAVPLVAHVVFGLAIAV